MKITIVEVQLRTFLFKKNAEVSPSECIFKVADYRKKFDCKIVEFQLLSNISLTSFGTAILEVLPTSCGIAFVDLKFVHAHLC
jgi:hypothetical protein